MHTDHPPSHADPTAQAPTRPPPAGDDTRSVALDDLSIALGVAGLLPILPVLGSVAAVMLGWLSPVTTSGGRSARARAGMALGLVGLAAPVVALFTYCVLLGYPFPIHRYAGR